MELGCSSAATVDIHAESLDDAGIHPAASRVRGVIGGTDHLPQRSVRYVEVANGMRTGFTIPARFNEDGTLFIPPLPEEPSQEPQEPGGERPEERRPTMTRSLDCGMADDRRCELYEALPSFLLATAGRMPAYAERMGTARGANGVWGRAEGARGEWTADRADSTRNLSYDYGVSGGRAGIDFAGERARIGFSIHALRSEAEIDGVGEIALNGTGFGASVTWTFDDFYADVRGQATWLDAEIDSSIRGEPLENEATGLGGALGVEVGGRMPLMEGRLLLTPRAGLVWTAAALGDFAFTDSVSATRVSVEDARSVRGVAGVTLESPMANGGRLFGTLDLASELWGERSARVADARLKTDAQSTTARLGAGGAFALTGGAGLRASVYYETGGSGSGEYGGGVTFSVRF